MTIPSEFGSLPSSPPPDFFSDLNFSKFPDFEIPPLTTDDVESPERNFPEIKGTYTNSDIGFQVDLPKDWKGKELKFLVDLVFASPNEISLSNSETLPEMLMTISRMNEASFNMIAGFQITGSGGGGGGELLQSSNPLDITASFGNAFSCNYFPSSIVTINGINA